MTADALSEEAADAYSGTIASGVRSLAIRYTIMMPKLKGAAIFQPEDHVSQKHIKHPLHGSGSAFARRAVSAAHTGSIFFCGTVLFVAHERTLRAYEPHNPKADLRKASPTAMAVSGACGGFCYALCATATASWLGTAEISSSPLRSHPLRFYRAAIPYTIARDSAGFACYFGIYRLANEHLSRWLGVPDRQHAEGTGAQAPGGMPAVQTVREAAPATSADVLRSIVVTALSGGLSGVATYVVRSPLDTLYKKAIGWRKADAPLWSWERFVSSPRGLKALGLGALTWTAYEAADTALRMYAV